jgi:DNA-binding MarR family transcriptional regulator
MTVRDQDAAVDRLGFLLARHGQVMNIRLRQALSVSGLSPRHGGVLTRLAHAGATSQQDLIDALAVDASALVTILNDLERDGLLERRRDPTDRRRHIVDITSAGRQAACAVEGAIADAEREAFGDLDAEEIEQLQSLLARVRTRGTSDACGSG